MAKITTLLMEPVYGYHEEYIVDKNGDIFMIGYYHKGLWANILILERVKE